MLQYIWCISRRVLQWCMVNISTLCILGHLWFAVSMTLWLDVVWGLLCQWLCYWTWYKVCCDWTCKTRFDVSMTLWLDVIWSLLCQWLSDWTWYEVCCVSDTEWTVWQSTCIYTYKHASWEDITLRHSSSRHFRKIKIYGRNMTT